jgi:hypothetical protein
MIPSGGSIMRRSFRASSLFGALLSGVVLAMSPASAGAALTEDDFFVKQAQDLVDLCSADPADPLHGEAIHFCHGFASGAWQYHEAQAFGPDGVRIVCVPDPSPTRNDAIAGFLTWAAANPEHMSEPGVEALFRFLHEKWPCAKGDSK